MIIEGFPEARDIVSLVIMVSKGPESQKSRARISSSYDQVYHKVRDL